MTTFSDFPREANFIIKEYSLRKPLFILNKKQTILNAEKDELLTAGQNKKSVFDHLFFDFDRKILSN